MVALPSDTTVLSYRRDELADAVRCAIDRPN
jgi:hypothetical protein